jgi:hypothetical protein
MLASLDARPPNLALGALVKASAWNSSDSNPQSWKSVAARASVGTHLVNPFYLAAMASPAQTRNTHDRISARRTKPGECPHCNPVGSPRLLGFLDDNHNTNSVVKRWVAKATTVRRSERSRRKNFNSSSKVKTPRLTAEHDHPMRFCQTPLRPIMRRRASTHISSFEVSLNRALEQTRLCPAPWARPKRTIMRWSPLNGYIVWDRES